MAKKEKSITYKDSGVDIDTGNEFVKKLPMNATGKILKRKLK